MILPHNNLYTRLKACSKGVGVFAIREIPQATKLFVGDIGETVKMLISDVDRLEDAELRRMYYDFCPVKDGCFVAPIDFNQMAMGWYLNHSNDPNVHVEDRLHFVTTRFIRVGEEVTANYTTYSQHAAKHIHDWET
ncbi:MAG: SET domain-containing protein [Nitrobacter sp.]